MKFAVFNYFFLILHMKFIVFVAAAVFQSLLETSLEENSKMNINRMNLLLQRSFKLTKHPLLQALAGTVSESRSKVILTGSKMLTRR